jgi:hypothetical protein
MKWTLCSRRCMKMSCGQAARDLSGNILVDKMVVFLFQIEDGLIRRFDIGSD